MKTYKELANDNKYLYGQLENCTMLMGLALLSRQDKTYKAYQVLKDEIKIQIEINLQLIENIWESPIIERSAKHHSPDKMIKFEARVIEFYKSNSNLTFSEISYKTHVSKSIVEQSINKYLSSKYG